MNILLMNMFFNFFKFQFFNRNITNIFRETIYNHQNEIIHDFFKFAEKQIRDKIHCSILTKFFRYRQKLQ